MKTSLFTLCISILFPLLTNAQNWELMGLQDVGHVNDIALYNGDLYITGTFETIDGVQMGGMAMWDGTSWQPIGSGFLNSASPGHGNCMEVYNNELYVGGVFTTVDGTAANKIAKWNGTTWSAVGGGLSMMGVARDFLHLGDKLYIGGTVYGACNTPDVNMVSWDGNSYATVGSGELTNLPGITGGYVLSLCDFNGDLYAAGVFTGVDGAVCSSGIARWDGTSWSGLPSGLPHQQGMDVAVLGGNLTIALGNYTVHQLIGGQWVDYMQGYSIPGGTYTMLDYNNAPVLAGFYNSGPIYLNSTWQDFGTMGVNHISDLRILGGELYAVGHENTLGNLGNVVQNTYVARWDGQLSVDEAEEELLGIYPNPGSDFLHIEDATNMTTFTVSMMNGAGEELGKWENTHTINVSELPIGVYFVTVSSESGIKRTKWIKSGN